MKLRHSYTCQHFLTTSMHNNLFLMDEALLITLEPDGIFGSNFVYLCILTLSSHWYGNVKKFQRASFGPVELFW